MSGTSVELIGGSHRADGSVRKVRRVKPGYTPPDEQVKFKSAAGKFNEFARSGGIAGLERTTAPSQRSATVAAPKTKSQIKNEKKKQTALRKKENAKAELLDRVLSDDCDTRKPPAASAEVTSKTSQREAAVAAPTTDASKRMKNLQKKLKNIAQLQEKIDKGELKEVDLEEGQIQKLKSRQDVEKEIESLASQLAAAAV